MASLLAAQAHEVRPLNSLPEKQFPGPESRRGLYVHLPFCKAKCHYCDFSAFAGQEKHMRSYLEALKTEMEKFAGARFGSVFIGGGTPTHLAPPLLKELLNSLRESFDIPENSEFTMECNPESFTPDKAEILLEGGVNRISFGLQTTDDQLLRRLGRIHNFQTFLKAYEGARRAGFSNINLDLMYGLPGQSLAGWERTLEEALALGPEHLSAYSLKIEEGTEFDRQDVQNDDDLQADMYLLLHDTLVRLDYQHYEISNFAKPGRHSQHNCLYWEDGEYIGLGCSAASSLAGKRWQNDPTLEGYIRSMTKTRQAVVFQEELTGGAKMAEHLMLGLRLEGGIALPFSHQEIFEQVFKKYAGLGFITLSSTRILPTLQGWLLSNQLFSSLLQAGETRVPLTV